MLPKNLLNENLNAIQNAASDFKARQRNKSVDEYEKENPQIQDALFEALINIQKKEKENGNSKESKKSTTTEEKAS